MRPDLESLTHHDVLPDGTRVVMRPLTPQDGALYPEFAAHVTPADARLRFFTAIAGLSQERISELTHIDYDSAMAFIAIDEAAGVMLGVVRLHLDKDRRTGEYAVTVRSALKGHGLGWLLMQRIIDYARVIGLERIHGQVLSENTTMLRMCAELGFHVADDPNGSGIKLVTLELAQTR
jgi:acetyltransferase